MDTNKVSNLFSYSRDKYGEDSVKLLRFWEFTVMKMVDNKNHRRFTLRYIEAGITPVSCRIRNPINRQKLSNHPQSWKTISVQKSQDHK